MDADDTDLAQANDVAEAILAALADHLASGGSL
jgi:hypothetical protein